MPEQLHDQATLDDLWGDPGDVRHRSPRARGARRVLGALAVVVVLAVLAGGWWVRSTVVRETRGDQVEVAVPDGAGHAAIAELLADRGIVAHELGFRIYLRWKGAEGFAAGSYRFREHMSMGDALAVLEAGPALPPADFVTIPEGLTVRETAEAAARGLDRLDAARFLESVAAGQVRSQFQPEGKPLEGLLFPDTYRLEEHESEAALLAAMVTAFDQVAVSVGLDQAQARVGHSPYEVAIVASLIEAEAKDDEDRAKIARVIYNRLELGMTLGIDATFYYDLPPDRKGTALRQSDLDRDGPYNTRLRAGLVPTPIMAPGRASLEAALAPEPGNWLFYVLKDERTHAFSETDAQFQRDVAEARRKGLL